LTNQRAKNKVMRESIGQLLIDNRQLRGIIVKYQVSVT